MYMIGSRYNKNDIAKMCEIAFIFGQLLEKKEIESNWDDLHDFFDDHVEPLYAEWVNGNGDFKDEEDMYVTAYTNRVIRERYKK